ncbi:MAG: HAD family hydrolase [Candidatus Kapabacteria bacterium]|nr:HAD family hydrolase [Candidatus Kapabacteria bacterium]
MLKDCSKIIIFDFWQTIAVTKVALFSSIIQKINPKISLNNFIDKIFTSSIYCSDTETELLLPVFFKKLGLSDEDIDYVWSLWQKAAFSATLLSGAKELILKLKKQNSFKLCLLSNVDRYGYENFAEKAFLEANFDYLFLSYQQGLVKPDNRCWQNICNHFRVTHEDVLMIGDSVDHDIAPACRSIIKGVLVGSGQQVNRADYYVDKLSVKDMEPILHDWLNNCRS